MDVEKPNKFIDIDQVIRSKNPRLLYIIPHFLIRLLKKLIHQEEMNEIIRINTDQYGQDFVRNALQYFGTQYKVLGEENIPASGRFIFASNHPLGGLDGMILIDAIGKHFPNPKFIVNDLLLNVKNLDPVFVPVNKHGRQNTDYAKRIEDAYRSDDQIIYFPAGLCSRKIKGKITDLPWQKNFVSKAVKFKRDIIPVYVNARNSHFFYNLARFRKGIGLKVNIEMIFLPDEMFKQKNKPISITFGKPISYTQFENPKQYQQIANQIRDLVYTMR